MATARDLMNAYQFLVDPQQEAYERHIRELAYQEQKLMGAMQKPSSLYDRLGLSQNQFGQAPQPVPQPEPNKVLLLLGEDE